MPNKIEEIDKNLKVTTNINIPGIKFYDPEEKPFRLYGITGPKASGEGKYIRLPRSVAHASNGGVEALFANTAGGRIRFTTDSSFIAIQMKSDCLCDMPHMTRTGSAGFSAYVCVDGHQYFAGSAQTNSKDYEAVIELGSSEKRDIILYMPLYNEVTSLYIGLDGEAYVLESPLYSKMNTIVYYGSSITQGGCASRPGMDYQGYISRIFDCDYINLGFSGSARGEEDMARYIAELPMSCFVMDYDHNAPDAEHLKHTHKRFFDIIREKNPNLPIIILTAPVKTKGEFWAERASIIKSTYEKALENGDKNVYFIEGSEFFDELPFNDGTVDGCHPTDLGFYFMAKKIAEILKKII